MIGRDDRFPVLAIWLLILLGAVQLIVWFFGGGVPLGYTALLPAAICWLTLLLLAALLTRRASVVQHRLAEDAAAHTTTLQQLDELRLHIEMLQIIGHAPDVREAFQTLAPRIEVVISCDRVGLALLSEDGEELQTFTARALDGERHSQARQELLFRVQDSALGQVVRSRHPLVIADTRHADAGQLDAIVLAGAGLHSALIIPLIAQDRAVGTLNLVARRAGGFSLAQAGAIQWIADMLAAAWVAQQRQLALGRQQTMEVMGELTLSIAAEINSALQAIMGHCELIRGDYQDERLHRDLDTVLRQAERIATLLGRIRSTTQEQIEEVAATMERKGA